MTSYAEYRDYVILQLLMDTGMRIGETLNLKSDNVLIEKKAIFIPAEIAKGRKDRYVFFSTIMQSILRKWIDYKERYFDSEYLFTSSRGSNFNLEICFCYSQADMAIYNGYSWQQLEYRFCNAID